MILAGYVLDSGGYGLAAFRGAGASDLGPASGQRDEGVPRRPGGPPHPSRWNGSVFQLLLECQVRFGLGDVLPGS